MNVKFHNFQHKFCSYKKGLVAFNLCHHIGRKVLSRPTSALGLKSDFYISFLGRSTKFGPKTLFFLHFGPKILVVLHFENMFF